MQAEGEREREKGGVTSVEPEAFPWSCSASSPSPLLCTGLRDSRHQQRLHPDPWIVHLHTHTAPTSFNTTHTRAVFFRAYVRTFCLENPGSMTNTTPSMVREVSAMFVETTTLRPMAPLGLVGGADSKILCWSVGGRVE